MVLIQLWLCIVACRTPEKAVESAPPGDTWADSAVWETDWEVPACDAVSGSSALTWTLDAGLSVAPSDGEVEANTAVTAIQPLSAAGQVLAVHDGALYRSADAGCTWTSEALPDGQNRSLVAGPGDIVWGWSESLDTLLRIEGDTVELRSAPDVDLVGLGVDAVNPELLRAGGEGCDIWQSSDGGETWSLLFEAPVDTLSAHAVVFDPDDVDHLLCAQTHEGVWVSVNGGDRWDQGRGLTSSGELNGFSARFVPGERDVVWMHALYPGEGARDAIFRSADGGVSWEEALVEGAGLGEGVSIDSDAPIAVHPGAPNVLAFAGGTTLYTYDARAETLTANAAFAEHEIQAIAASPAAPGTWYLGFGDSAFAARPSSVKSR